MTSELASEGSSEGRDEDSGRKPGDDVAPGQAVGDWIVEARLGDAGVCVVHAARHRTSAARGVLKVLRANLAVDASLAARITRDARSLRGLDHEGVVPLLDAGKLEDGRPWLVTSVVEDPTLRDELAARGKLAPERAWSIARALLDALAAAHPLGLVHRDVSPSNVVLAGVARAPRMIDFGLARSPAQDGDATPPAPEAVTASMAPEACTGDVVDARADLYGVGVTLFEMLVGGPPFSGASPRQLVEAILHAAPPSPRGRGAPIGAGVDVFVRKLLAKSAADRFANAWAARSAGDHAFGRAPDAGDDAPPVAAAADDEPGPAPAVGSSAVPAAPEPRRAPWTPADAARHAPTYLVTHALIVTAGVAMVVALGYVGPTPRDVVQWMHVGGWTMLPILGTFLLAAGLVVRLGLARGARGEAGHAAFALAALPALLATLGSWQEGRALRAAADVAEAVDNGELFAGFSAGIIEAYQPRFVGFALSAIAFLAVAAMPTRRYRERRWPAWRTVDVVAIVLAAAAAAAVTAGARSGAFVAAVAAAAVVVGRGLSLVPTRLRFSEAIDHAVAALTATVLAAAAAFARLDARHAFAFGAQVKTRADRVDVIMAAAGEREASRWVAVIAVALVVGILVTRVVRTRPQGVPMRLPRTTSLVLLGLPAFLAVDAMIDAALQGRREELVAPLGEQLALQAGLDPPPVAPGKDLVLGESRAVATLVASSTAICVDGREVARTDALGTDAARDAIVDALARSASSAPDSIRPRRGLALIMDRRAPWSRVVTLLRLVRQSGIRTVDVMLTVGPSPTIPLEAPPEAALILRSDLDPLPIAIAAASADEWDFANLEEATTAWQAALADGDAITVGVGW